MSIYAPEDLARFNLLRLVDLHALAVVGGSAVDAGVVYEEIARRLREVQRFGGTEATHIQSILASGSAAGCRL